MVIPIIIPLCPTQVCSAEGTHYGRDDSLGSSYQETQSICELVFSSHCRNLPSKWHDMSTKVHIYSFFSLLFSSCHSLFWFFVFSPSICLPHSFGTIVLPYCSLSISSFRDGTNPSPLFLLLAVVFPLKSYCCLLCLEHWLFRKKQTCLLQQIPWKVSSQHSLLAWLFCLFLTLFFWQNLSSLAC